MVWLCLVGAFMGIPSTSAGATSRSPLLQFEPLLLVLREDVVVVHGYVDRVGEQGGIAAQALRMEGEALLIEDRRPWCILQHVVEDPFPGLGAGRSLLGGHHRVGLVGALVEGFVAVFRPVPASLDRAATAEDAVVEVR